MRRLNFLDFLAIQPRSSNLFFGGVNDKVYMLTPKINVPTIVKESTFEAINTVTQDMMSSYGNS